MGLEAYRIELKPVHPVKRQDVLNGFAELGFSVSGENLGDVYLEKAYDFGYIEIALQNSEWSRLFLNEYRLQQDQKEDVAAQPAEDRERITVQIAKPNHENIIDCLMRDVLEFNRSIPVTMINLQTKEKVDPKNYNNLKEHFKKARNEFEQWFPNLDFPVRCREVFKSS